MYNQTENVWLLSEVAPWFVGFLPGKPHRFELLTSAMKFKLGHFRLGSSYLFRVNAQGLFIFF